MIDVHVPKHDSQFVTVIVILHKANFWIMCIVLKLKYSLLTIERRNSLLLCDLSKYVNL